MFYPIYHFKLNYMKKMKRILIGILLTLIVIMCMGMFITSINNYENDDSLIEIEKPLMVEDWMLDENYFN